MGNLVKIRTGKTKEKENNILAQNEEDLELVLFKK